MNNRNNYNELMDRKNSILKKAMGIDYDKFELEGIAFDYELMMSEAGYSLEEVREILDRTSVGRTRLFKLRNITKLARCCAPKGKGATIYLKDESTNPSGSFKARRAAVSCYHAYKNGYKGVIAATSGNYGAAVASQAAMYGLKCIIAQECYDSKEKGQPEIIEKARACEAYGAEVIQLTVGPELFYTHLKLLEETGYFNASLYTPFAIAGVESLGYEIAEQIREIEKRDPDYVVVTNAGGGNITGTARGLIKAGCKDTKIIAASVDLTGLHMASDNDFNRKSFTTGHTGFGVPYSTDPDHSDVPRSAARALKYMDKYYTVNQGSVFYMTELLAQIEGLERGPAGNTSLAVAFKIAQELDRDKIIVVQETEYTGAGKHINPQLSFAKENGIKLLTGNPQDEVPGESIVLPSDPSKLCIKEMPLERLHRSYLKKVYKHIKGEKLTKKEMQFLQDELRIDEEKILKLLEEFIPNIKVEK